MRPHVFAMVMTAIVTTVPIETRAADEGWAERLSFKGDVRLRYEGIDEQFESRRDRMRFRARVGLTAEVQDDVQVVLQLATGGDNPVSTNQTFDDGFSRKDIRLDLAYVDWQVNDSWSINAGKMKNPIFPRRQGTANLGW